MNHRSLRIALIAFGSLQIIAQQVNGQDIGQRIRIDAAARIPPESFARKRCRDSGDGRVLFAFGKRQAYLLRIEAEALLRHLVQELRLQRQQRKTDARTPGPAHRVPAGQHGDESRGKFMPGPSLCRLSFQYTATEADENQVFRRACRKVATRWPDLTAFEIEQTPAQGATAELHAFRPQHGDIHGAGLNFRAGLRRLVSTHRRASGHWSVHDAIRYCDSRKGKPHGTTRNGRSEPYAYILSGSGG